MESLLGLFRKKTKPIEIQKKVILLTVPNNQQFEDLTLTKDFLDYLEDRQRRATEALVTGSWEEEGLAREYVGFIRACEDLKQKYKSLYKALYNK